MQEFNYPKLGERCFYDCLPSGLGVYVVPKRGFSKKYALFATAYGGYDEHFAVNGKWKHTPPGVAHFLEHKMFEMPEGHVLKTLSDRGASANAFTSGAMTGYYFTCTDRFEENLWTLLNAVMTPYFTEENVAKEQGIIGQEIRMIGDDPGRVCYRNLMQVLYAHHPIRNSIAGTVESISEITPEILTACHRAFYHPGNMVLCVVGDVDPREIIQSAAAMIPKAAEQEITRDHGEPETAAIVQQEVSVEMDVATTTFMIGMKVMPDGTLLQRLIGELAAEMLVGESGPLYAKLYQDGWIDRSFGASFSANRETAHLLFAGESEHAEQIVEAIVNEGIRIAWNGLEKARFERTKKALYGYYVRRMNAFDSIGRCLADGHFGGYRFMEFADLFDSITLESVRSFIQENVAAERCAISVVRPKGGTRA